MPVINSQNSESAAIVPHPPCGGPSTSKEAVMQPCYRDKHSTSRLLQSRVFGNFGVSAIRSSPGLQLLRRAYEPLCWLIVSENRDHLHAGQKGIEVYSDQHFHDGDSRP